ncbi:uncharacterized protein LOC132561957, partial [Ylistrum balloti]|uniref:uncharacterized protein LOC132561957 n=1 Tax=Ylistrum balloti TaxID=509963 RepID=UPI00290586F2
ILPIWFKVCRATIIVGAVVVANAAVLELLCTVVLSKASHKIVFILTTLAAFFGAACILSMAILWAYKIRHGFLTGDVDELVLNLSWSFGLSIAGGLLAGIGGLLVAIDFCRKPT